MDRHRRPSSPTTPLTHPCYATAHGVLPLPGHGLASASHCAEFNSATEWIHRHRQPTLHTQVRSAAAEQPRARIASPASPSKCKAGHGSRRNLRPETAIRDVTCLSRSVPFFTYLLAPADLSSPLLKPKHIRSSRCRDRDHRWAVA